MNGTGLFPWHVFTRQLPRTGDQSITSTCGHADIHLKVPYTSARLHLTFHPFSMEASNQAESSKISTSLEVEQIDVNLFRSVKLHVPVRARGVFGGQVISQAIVCATKCVDPAFGLHVSNLNDFPPSKFESSL